MNMTHLNKEYGFKSFSGRSSNFFMAEIYTKIN